MILKNFLLLVLLIVGIAASSTVESQNENILNEKKETLVESQDDLSAIVDNVSARELQSSNPRVSAEAYECDDDMIPIIDSALKRKGVKVRICFQPTIPTLARDIRMRSIDDFTFYKEFGAASQKIVVGRSESAEF